MCLCLDLGEAQSNRSLPKQQSSDAQQVLAQATDAFERDDLIKAKALLQNVLQEIPRSVTAHTLAGAIADRENDFAKAESHFALAAKLSPQSPETRNNYGAILARLGRTKEAATEFTASLKVNPNQPSALVNLANIRFAEKDFNSAQTLFEKAKAIAPDTEILRSLVVVALRLSETEKARIAFQEYFLTAKNSDASTVAQMELGLTLITSGLNSEAAQVLNQVVAAEPNNADAIILFSRAYLEQKNVPAAGKVLESAIARGIDGAKIYAALAETYEAGGYLENAVPAMRLAIEKEPKNEFYQARYGLLLIDAKAPAAAVIRLKEAVQDMPNSARLWLALGIAQLTEGRMAADAQSSFEQSLKLEPKSIPALAYLGTIYTDAANYAEAAKFYERALAIEERNALLHYLLADTLLKIPGSDQSLIEKHLQRAVLLDTKLAPAHFALGKFYARLEHWPQATDEFKQAVAFAPDLAEAHYQLGRALVRLKRPEEAKPEFELYKKLNETQTAQNEVDRQKLVRRLANVRF